MYVAHVGASLSRKPSQRRQRAIILLASPTKPAPTSNSQQNYRRPCGSPMLCLPSLSSLDSRADNCHNMQIFHSMCAYVIHLFCDANVKMLYNSICILLNCVCSSLSSSSSSSQFHVKQFCAHHHFNRNIYMVLNCRFAPAHFWASRTSERLTDDGTKGTYLLHYYYYIQSRAPSVLTHSLSTPRAEATIIFDVSILNEND